MAAQLGNKEIMAQNIQYYMDMHGKSRNDMCQALGIKYTTFTDWINAKTYPRIESIELMANYFGIEKSDLVERRKSPNLDEVTNLIYPSAYPVPILGDICAGNGVWCEDNFNGYFYIDKSIKADMCLQVRGDSMIDAGINDGDYAFIKKDYDFINGKIYAVRINSDCEAVLKKVYIEDNTFVLNPCNSNYKPIVTNSTGASIIGECVGVYHSV